MIFLFFLTFCHFILNSFLSVVFITFLTNSLPTSLPPVCTLNSWCFLPKLLMLHTHMYIWVQYAKFTESPPRWRAIKNYWLLRGGESWCINPIPRGHLFFFFFLYLKHLSVRIFLYDFFSNFLFSVDLDHSFPSTPPIPHPTCSLP